jgi:Tol biopolymer transport system component
VWLDRTGKRLGVITKPDIIQGAALSPDNKNIAFEVSNSTSRISDIWLEDLARGATSRFTFGPGAVNRYPVWSPDASHIVYASNQGPLLGLYQKSSSGAGKEELLLQGGINTHPDDWSRDGKFIVYTQTGERTKDDLWLLPIEGDHKPIPYINTQFDEIRGQFSPDGRWMAYDSDESGQQRVYVQTVPVSGAKLQISTAGGSQPRWRRDGKELFYLAADGKLMAVPVKLAPSFEAGTPQPLFEGIPLALDTLGRSFSYQPSADGQRFLVNLPAAGEAAAPANITVVLNWQAELRK